MDLIKSLKLISGLQEIYGIEEQANFRFGMRQVYINTHTYAHATHTPIYTLTFQCFKLENTMRIFGGPFPSTPYLYLKPKLVFKKKKIKPVSQHCLQYSGNRRHEVAFQGS